jgi:hypothetical protein
MTIKVQDQGNRYVFEIAKATQWAIAKGPLRVGNRFCGPGYVYLVETPWGDLTNDLHQHTELDGPAIIGGLGCFNIHVSYPKGSFHHWRHDIVNGRNNAKEMTDPNHGSGCGVVGSRVVRAPTSNKAGIVSVTLEVDIAHAMSYPKPAFTVRYLWKFGLKTVEMVAKVTALPGEPVWIKEPRTVVALHGDTAYTLASCFTRKGELLKDMPLGSLGDPRKHTIQMRDVRRWQVVFSGDKRFPKFAFCAGGWNHKQYKPEVWRASDYGFDAWAKDANSRAKLEETCPDYCLQTPISATNQAHGLSRSWELAMEKGTTDPHVSLCAWAGGIGPNDCKCASRLIQPGMSYAVWTRYAWKGK